MLLTNSTNSGITTQVQKQIYMYNPGSYYLLASPCVNSGGYNRIIILAAYSNALLGWVQGDVSSNCPVVALKPGVELEVQFE